MNDPQQRLENLSPERRALLTIKRLQLELEALKKERTEPIAIIGMSCRFPGGANSPEAFWQLLVEGRDAITEVPPDRYDINEFYDPDVDAPGKTVSRWGGFLDAIDQFDPMFFGISPREATYLDPQQRLLLEVTWEAMERAGLLPEKLSGSQTGVFIGLFNRDYFDMQLEQMIYDNASSANPYTGIGNGPSFAAGRISYLLGLQGPSMVIDTVCSSSLVAIHQACQSLRNNECTTAFAGATNLIFYPLSTIVTSKMRALSPQGRSKTFDASADGFVRGEGCGVVILKRLSQALSDGDPILALIRGSAVNQDGRSSGLTAPNGLAQQAVMREALRNAGLSPEHISYVETHGTGTVLGDPIEFDALRAVIGDRPRPDGSQCMLGSVKTNIGHLESCAGMAGLIKTVLCMQHGMIPPVLHLKNLNPHISLENTPFVIPTSLQTWPEGVERKYAGVSGAGLSGTNAHVVLEEAPEPASMHSGVARTEMKHIPFLLPLSARDPEALRQLAHLYQRELSTSGSAIGSASLQDICYTASMRRTHHPYRMAVVGQSHEELAFQLEEFAEGRLVSETAGETKQDPVFVFAGQGTQWPRMGWRLFEQEPVFRAVIEECNALLEKHVQWSLLEALQADERHSRLNETEVAQVALFATQVALAALWRSWGIVPGAVVGHSVGEIAAAHVAGVLSLDDAVQVVVQRGRLMQQAHGLGKMAAVRISEAEAKRLLVDYPTRLSIAAVNSQMGVVLSGEAQALEEVLRSIELEGGSFRRLQVDYAFHSPQMERFRAPLVTQLQRLKPGRASIPLVSTVTGQQSSGEEYDADYWGRNMCQEVRFGPALEELIRMGYQTFLEISPQPALMQPIKQTLEQHGKSGLVLPSLRQGLAERLVMLTSLGALYAQGYAVHWDQLYSTAAGPYTVVALPTYQWQRKRYWFTEKKPGFRRYMGSYGKLVRHPLLGQRLRSAAKEIVFEKTLDTHTISWLNDHQVYGTVVLPASAYVEMMLASARETLKEAIVQLDELFIHQALVLSPDSSRLVQLIVNPSTDKTHAAVQVFSRPEDGEDDEDTWILHADGNVRVERSRSSSVAEPLQLAEIQSRCAETVEGTRHYQQMRDIGLQYGVGFQGVGLTWRRDGEALASVVLPWQLNEEAEHYYMHPALLDACFQVVEASLVKGPAESPANVYLPISMDRIRFYARPGKNVWCHVQAHPESAETETMRVVDVEILDENGQVIAEVNGLHLRRAPREALIPRPRQQVRDWFYEMGWERQAREATPVDLASSSVKDGNWLILCDRRGTGTRLAQRLREKGEQCVLVFAGQDDEIEESGCHCIDPTNAAELHRLLVEHFSDGRSCRGIIHLWGLDAVETEQATVASLEASQSMICGSVLHIIQAVVDEKWSYSPQLWIITRGSQAVIEGENDLSVAQAPVWGLGRVVAMEQPDFQCKRIDLDRAADVVEETEELLQEIQQADREDQVAFRSHERYVARLSRSARQLSRQQQSFPHTFRADSTYLITGGLGGLGLATARWMVEHRGVKHLVLVGRSGASDAVRVAVDELERSAAQVLVMRADIAQEDQVAQLLATVQSTMPPLRGIIHAAGVLDDGVLLQQNWERFSRVMAPKVKGTWNLHTLTRDLPLDFFVLFSSGASLMGSAGQGNYAAANAFMDALAHYRCSRGLPATSINWGAWADTGMVTTSAGIERRLAKDGMQAIDQAQGLTVLDQLLQQGPVQIGVLPIDWETLAKHVAGGERPPFLKKLLDEVQLRVADSRTSSLQGQRDDLLRKLEAVPESEKLDVLQQYVYWQVRQVLGLDPGFKLEPAQNLFEIGMDSLMAVELRNRFHSMLEKAIPANLVFDHPGVGAITAYLAPLVLALAES
ncbi:type I polyketide synthase [Dictyobacter aurantiacus]|nr:type I polyketide synthase [Dictyobacter aurantiacus]